MLLPRLLRHLDRDRSRDVELDRRRARLGDERAIVEKSDALAVLLDRERPVERRRQPKRDLDLVGVDEGGEPPARVASVRGRERPSKVARERDLHSRETTD